MSKTSSIFTNALYKRFVVTMVTNTKEVQEKQSGMQKITTNCSNVFDKGGCELEVTSPRIFPAHLRHKQRKFRCDLG